MNEWKHINYEKPKDMQLVWYWFGHFDKIYAGRYTKAKEEDCCTDIFYSAHGYLGDDITWWMPREEGDTMPNHPTKEQKAACKYHPIQSSEIKFLRLK